MQIDVDIYYYLQLIIKIFNRIKNIVAIHQDLFHKRDKITCNII